MAVVLVTVSIAVIRHTSQKPVGRMYFGSWFQGISVHCGGEVMLEGRPERILEWNRKWA